MPFKSGHRSRSARRPSKIVKRAYKEERRFPRRFFGTAHYRRGGSESLQNFGASRRMASVEQQGNRKQYGFTGKGGYWGQRAGDWLSGATGFGGLGKMGSDLENQAINKGVGWLQKYTGGGAYNSLINPDGTNVPEISGTGLDATSMTVSHREYVADIQGTSTFVNNTFLINPGNAVLFPWLSQMAQNFDEYEFNQLIFGYKSVTADSTVSSTQIGSIIMACNYNATAAAFTAKVPMMEYESAISDRVTTNMTFGIECDDSKNALKGSMFVTPSLSAPAGEDPKTYFMGLMQIAVNQCLNTGEIGELWVEYTVTLRKRKLFTALYKNVPQVYVESGAYNNTAYTPTAANIMGIPSGLLTNTSNRKAVSFWPCYYYYGAYATEQLMRTAKWTQDNSKAFTVTWNSTTLKLTLYLPDAYTGAIQFASTEVAGAGTFGDDQTYISTTNTLLYRTGLQQTKSAAYSQTHLFAADFTTSAQTQGVAGATGTGNWVSFLWTFNTTVPSAVTFLVEGVNPQ